MTATNGNSYVLRRTLEAPVAKVWRAWTTPTEYAAWASAAPGSVEMDVRPGGAWKALMVSPGGEFPLTGSYLEVAPNSSLVIGMDVPGRSEPVSMTVSFEDLGSQTGLVLSQTCDTAQERAFAEQGSTVLLDGLAVYLTKS